MNTFALSRILRSVRYLRRQARAERRDASQNLFVVAGSDALRSPDRVVNGVHNDGRSLDQRWLPYALCAKGPVGSKLPATTTSIFSNPSLQ